jgi:hypothetical protein
LEAVSRAERSLSILRNEIMANIAAQLEAILKAAKLCVLAKLVYCPHSRDALRVCEGREEED